MSERDTIGLALLFAYVNRRAEAVDFLLEKDGNWNMTGVNNGAVMHRAAWEGDLAMVKRLVAKGADIHNRDNPFNSTPLSWAQHNKQRAVFDWMRANCAIDLHEAVRLLLDHGADPNIVAGDGNAPLDVARTSGARRIVALLEERGARSAAEL